MDPRIELMQRQAQYAIEQQPENKELILKALSEDMGAVAMEWTEQANLAITNNNTKEYRAKVTEALKKDLLDNGFNAGEDFQIPPIPGKDFNGKVAAGSASTAEPSYEQDKFDGETEEEYYDRKEREGQRLAQETGVSATRQRIADERGALSQMGRLGADLEAAGKGAYSNLVRGAGAAVGIGAGVGDVLMPGDWYSEAGFDAQKAMQEHAANVDSSISPLASENARMGGEIVGSLLTFPVAPFQRGQDALDKGKSLGRAELALGEEALIQELGLATGKLGSQAKGFVPYLTRAGAQVPANVALGAGSRALAGEDYTKKDLFLDAAMGAGGGIFRDAPVVKKPSLEELFKLGEDSVLPPEVEKSPTLWEGSSDPVNIDVNAPYVQNFSPAKPKDVNYGIAPETKTIVDGAEVATAPPLSSVPEAAFPNQGEGVAVSHSPLEAATEVAPQAFPVEGKEFTYKTKYNPNTLTAKIAAKAAAEAKPVHTLDSLKKQLDEVDELDFGGPQETLGQLTKIVPPSIKQSLNEGTLNVGKVLDSVINNEGGLFSAVPEVVEYAKMLRALGAKFGGEDHPMLRPEQAGTPDRVASAQAATKVGIWRQSENRAYLGKAATIKTMLHEAGHAILVRATKKGEQALLDLEAGRIPSLDGPAIAAFRDLKKSMEIANIESTRLADEYKSSLIKEGKSPEEADALAGRTMRYGFNNVHEMLSELYANPAFREHLKSIKMTPELGSTVGLGRLAIAKAKNLYEGIMLKVKTFLGMDTSKLGLSPKSLDNALDALFAGSNNYFSKLSKSDIENVRSNNAAWPEDVERQNPPVPVEDFEDVAGATKAMPEGESAIKHKPLGKVGTFLKAAWAGKGVNSRITLAKERLAGNKQEARVIQIANINKARTLVGNLKGVSRKSAMNDMAVIFKDAASDDAKKAMASLRGTSPELAGFVSKLATDNWKGATDLAKALVKSQEGKKLPDQKILNFAAKLLENRGKYSYRAYGDSAAQKTKFKLANKAAAKAKAGKTLTNEETKALTELNNLKGYIRHNIYGDAEALSKLTSPTLHGLYEDAFGNLEPLKGLSKKDAKALMIEELADYNGNMFNKDGAVDEMVETISGMNNDAAAKYYKGMKYGKDTLKARDDVPKAIRDWWGEIEDPLTRQILSRTIQSLQKAEVETLNALRTDGLADGTFSSQRGMGHKEQITGPGSGALEGLYTTPDVMAVIDSVTQFGSKAEGVYDAMVQKKSGAEGIGAAAWTIAKIPVQVMRTAKTMETVGNIGGWLRNAAGSPAQLWSNGNFINPKYTAKGINVTRKLINLAGKEDMGPEELRMIRLGLAEGTQTHETFSPRVRSKMDKLLQLMGEDPNEAISWLRTLKDSGGASVDFLKEAYGAVDLWPKMANFYYEHDFQSAYNKRHGIKMDPDELDRQVADRVKQTNITYSRSPAALKLIESAGVTRFVNYYYETFRTSANNIGIGLSDFAKGLKEKDVQLASHGARRVVGTVGAVNYTTALYAAGLKASAGALGYVAAEAGDALTDYMEDDSFMDPESTVLVSDGNKKYGLDAGMIAPLDPVDSVVKNMIRAAFDPENAEKHIGKATENAFNLLSNNSMIAGAVKALQGRQPAMAKTDPKLYEQILGWNEANTGLKPETVDAFINTLSPLIPKTPKEVSRGLNTDADPKIKEAIGSGVGMYEINPEKDIKTYLGRSFKLETGEARKAYSSLLSKPIDVTPERLEKAFKEGMLQLAKPYAKLERAYKAALEEGSDKDDLLDAIEAKVSGDVVDMLEDGALLPAKLIYMDMSSQAEQAIEDAEEKDKAKVEERWYKKLDALDDILYKYEDMTLEDIEKGALDG